MHLEFLSWAPVDIAATLEVLQVTGHDYKVQTLVGGVAKHEVLQEAGHDHGVQTLMGIVTLT